MLIEKTKGRNKMREKKVTVGIRLVGVCVFFFFDY